MRDNVFDQGVKCSASRQVRDDNQGAGRCDQTAGFTDQRRTPHLLPDIGDEAPGLISRASFTVRRQVLIQVQQRFGIHFGYNSDGVQIGLSD